MSHQLLSGKSVIIVDDTPSDREILNACCQQLGMQILAVEESAYSTLSRIDLLARQQVVVDVMLIDIMMVGMDGNVLSEEIRLDKRFDKTRLIAVSSDKTAAKLKHQGGCFDAFYPKPVASNTLQDVIAGALHLAKPQLPSQTRVNTPQQSAHLLWSEVYATGIPEVDEQHKKLFAFINKFHDDIHAEKGVEAIDQALKFLESYSRTHFGYEEMCMHRFQCPYHDQNKQAHEAFMKNFEAFKHKFEIGHHDLNLAKEIHKTVKYWIINHICRIDVHLKDCVRKGDK